MPVRNRSPRRRIVLFALLVAASLLLLAMGTSAQVRDLRSGVNYALSPVREALAGGARSVGSMFAAFTEIDQLRNENRDLAARVAQLDQQISQLEVLRTENARLSQLLDTQRALAFDTVAASVTQGPADQFVRVISIDRGSDAGVEVNDAVLAPGGALAGVVTEVFKGGSTVRLLSDTRSLIIGMDVVTRATGEVTGDLSQPLIMGRVPGTETLTIGDTIVTAGQLVTGIKAVLPKDLLIGRIVQVTNDTGQFEKSALVLPAADLDRLESVLVVTSYEGPRIPGSEPTPDPDQPDASEEPGPTTRPGRTAKPGKTPGP